MTRRAVLTGRAFASVLVALLGSVLLFPAGSSHGAPLADAERGWTRQLTGEPLWVAGDTAGFVVAVQPDETVAFDRRGSEVWHATVGQLAFFGRPTMDASTVVVATTDGHVALDRATGAVRWTRALAGAGAATIFESAAGRGVCVTSTIGALACLDATNGRTRWSTASTGEIVTAPIVDVRRGVVLTAWHTHDGGALRVMDLATGALRWEVPLLVLSGAPVLTGDTVLVAEGDGNFQARVVAVDLATATRKWATPLPASFEIGIEPASDGTMFAVVDHFGTVSMIEVGSGRLAWQTKTHRALVLTRVALTAREVVVSVHPDALFVLDRASGRILRKDVRRGVVADHLVVDRDLVTALRRPGRLVSTRMP